MSESLVLSPGPLALIAQGIRDRLEVALPPRWFTYRWAPARFDRAAWRALTQRPPSIGLGFQGFDAVQTTGDLTAMSQWHAFVVTRNEGGPEPLLFGDTLAPGQLAIAETAAAILHGFTLPGLGTIQVTSAGNAFFEEETDQTISVTGIEMTVKADLSLSRVLRAFALQPADLTSQNIVWGFPPNSAQEQS